MCASAGLSYSVQVTSLQKNKWRAKTLVSDRTCHGTICVELKKVEMECDSLVTRYSGVMKHGNRTLKSAAAVSVLTEFPYVEVLGFNYEFIKLWFEFISYRNVVQLAQ